MRRWIIDTILMLDEARFSMLGEREAARRAAEEMQAAAAVPPAQPTYNDTPCSCGSTYFVSGGNVIVPRSNGVSAVMEVSGGVLSCLQCGLRWYQTEKGLRRPHELAMPAAWAQHDLQVRWEQAKRERLDKAAEAPGRRRTTGAHEGFRMPPSVDS